MTTEAVTTPTTFWCNDCQAWTSVEEPTEEQIEAGTAALDEFWCSDCGGFYQCDECGADIDREGNCLRHETDGTVVCPSRGGT